MIQRDTRPTADDIIEQAAVYGVILQPGMYAYGRCDDRSIYLCAVGVALWPYMEAEEGEELVYEEDAFFSNIWESGSDGMLSWNFLGNVSEALEEALESGSAAYGLIDGFEGNEFNLDSDENDTDDQARWTANSYAYHYNVGAEVRRRVLEARH